MQIKSFTKDDTLIYKGIGILLIVFHNFFHKMPLLEEKENEWTFASERVVDFYQTFIQNPFDCFNVLLSYFGHFGVQLFIFISGIGLALSMQHKTRAWKVFMVERLKKLYPLLIMGFVFLFFYAIIIDHRLLLWHRYLEFLYKLLFVHTFISKSGVSLSGPWWFFGLIFQLYVLFPLLFKVIKKYNIKAFVFICLGSYLWIYISQYVYAPSGSVYLLQNAPGHLPEFAFGILLALNPGKRIHFSWVVLSLILFSLGNFYKPFFPLTFLSITVVMYWTLTKIIPFILTKTQRLKTVLFYYGSISMIIFVIHGELRPPFLGISGEFWLMRYFCAFLFLLAATALSILGKVLYQWLVNRIERLSKK